MQPLWIVILTAACGVAGFAEVREERRRDARALLRRPLGPGSFWYQPAEQAHADSCLSEQCVMFIQWAGPRDARRAPRT